MDSMGLKTSVRNCCFQILHLTTSDCDCQWIRLKVNFPTLQSSWTKQAAEDQVDSPRLVSHLNEVPACPDSTCAQVINPNAKPSGSKLLSMTAPKECIEQKQPPGIYSCSQTNIYFAWCVTSVFFFFFLPLIILSFPIVYSSEICCISLDRNHWTRKRSGYRYAEKFRSAAKVVSSDPHWIDLYGSTQCTQSRL